MSLVPIGSQSGILVCSGLHTVRISKGFPDYRMPCQVFRSCSVFLSGVRSGSSEVDEPGLVVSSIADDDSTILLHAELFFSLILTHCKDMKSSSESIT